VKLGCVSGGLAAQNVALQTLFFKKPIQDPRRFLLFPDIFFQKAAREIASRPEGRAYSRAAVKHLSGESCVSEGARRDAADDGASVSLTMLVMFWGAPRGGRVGGA